jgi:shikimate dehydrogenase
VEISARTRLLAVVGDPVAHSLSPAMHNAACRALGIDAVYVAMRTPAESLPAVLQALATIGGAGNVTVPHKAAAERCIARKTDTCIRAEACNTFWGEGGQLVGDNTDVPGIQATLATLGVGKGGRWLVLGTGGSARAVAVAAAELKATLGVRSRHPERATQFAQWAARLGIAAEPVHGPIEATLVINTTPLGLAESDPLPLDPKEVAGNGTRVALDLVYARGETRWVRALKERRVTASDGREVLVRQGAAAFARFFPGHTAPIDVMRAAVERALRA